MEPAAGERPHLRRYQTLGFTGSCWNRLDAVRCRVMATSIETLERRIDALRAQVRQALMTGDRQLAASLRRELRETEDQWEKALDHLARDTPGPDEADRAAAGRGASPPGGGEPSTSPGSLELLPAAGPVAGQPGSTVGEGTAAEGPLPSQGGGEPDHKADGHRSGPLALPLREQVYQALTLLTVPAAPRLISAVHEAFFAGAIFGARLTSLRRDEERSFRTTPFARPYYLCAALTADLLAPARGLLAVSTWPMEHRVIGPLSPRVDFLTAAIQVAEGVQRLPSPTPEAFRLLWRLAVNIPGGITRAGKVDAPTVARAAETERGVHADADLATRRAAALRARSQLDDVQQLFGTRLRVTPSNRTAL